MDLTEQVQRLGSINLKMAHSDGYRSQSERINIKSAKQGPVYKGLIFILKRSLCSEENKHLGTTFTPKGDIIRIAP